MGILPDTPVIVWAALPLGECLKIGAYQGTIRRTGRVDGFLSGWRIFLDFYGWNLEEGIGLGRGFFLDKTRLAAVLIPMGPAPRFPRPDS
jgi:hypothetical protein